MNKKTSIATLIAYLVAASPAMAMHEARSLYVDLEISLSQTTVAAVIQSITQQTGYEFSYEEALLGKTIAHVSVKAKNEPIERVLDQVFGTTGIAYQVIDNRIFLQDKTTNTTLVLNVKQQQGKTISGTVIDNSGLPVIGANVILKGAAGIGTITDVDGNFTLDNIPDRKSVV